MSNLDNALSPNEAATVKSYLFDLYDEGLEIGLKKGIEKGGYIKNNAPHREGVAH